MLFFKKELEFLGFIVNKEGVKMDGVKMDPSRIQTLIDWKNHPPVTFRDFQVFLGFCNFYRRFIFGFASIAHSLHLLLRGMKNGRKAGNIGHEWQEPQQEAFERLITAFTTAPILRHYDPKLLSRVEADASDFALAAIISQLHPDGWHHIAFLSRKITDTESHYPVYDKELRAIVVAFRHWRHYLEGTINIQVWSDPENLTRFMAQTSINGRQARWLLQLAPYDFNIHYRKGSLNPADGPSRRPDYMEQAEESEDSPMARLIPTLQNKLANGVAQKADVSNESMHKKVQVNPMGSETKQIVRALVAQVTTRHRVIEAVRQDGPYRDQKLRELIREGQELDPFCKNVVSALHLKEGDKELRSRKADLLRSDASVEPPPRDAYAADTGESAMADSVLAKHLSFRRQGFDVSREGLLLRDKRVCVPAQEAVRHEILYLFHDCPSAGHWGVQKTLDLVQRHYTWPGIAKDIREYVEACAECQAKAIH